MVLYRLGDTVKYWGRHNNFGINATYINQAEFEGTIAREYTRATNRPDDIDTLIRICLKRTPSNILHVVVHVRLGDVMCPGNNRAALEKEPVDPARLAQLIKKHTPSDLYHLCVGLHNGRLSQSNRYLDALLKLLPVSRLNGTPDEDFIAMVFARNVIPGKGGFAELVRKVRARIGFHTTVIPELSFYKTKTELSEYDPYIPLTPSLNKVTVFALGSCSIQTPLWLASSAEFECHNTLYPWSAKTGFSGNTFVGMTHCTYEVIQLMGWLQSTQPMSVTLMRKARLVGVDNTILPTVRRGSIDTDELCRNASRAFKLADALVIEITSIKVFERDGIFINIEAALTLGMTPRKQTCEELAASLHTIRRMTDKHIVFIPPHRNPDIAARVLIEQTLHTFCSSQPKTYFMCPSDYSIAMSDANHIRGTRAHEIDDGTGARRWASLLKQACIHRHFVSDVDIWVVSHGGVASNAVCDHLIRHGIRARSSSYRQCCHMCHPGCSVGVPILVIAGDIVNAILSMHSRSFLIANATKLLWSRDMPQTDPSLLLTNHADDPLGATKMVRSFVDQHLDNVQFIRYPFTASRLSSALYELGIDVPPMLVKDRTTNATTKRVNIPPHVSTMINTYRTSKRWAHTIARAAPRKCDACDYEVTWDATHCCNNCRIGCAHGPACQRILHSPPI